MHTLGPFSGTQRIAVPVTSIILKGSMYLKMSCRGVMLPVAL